MEKLNYIDVHEFKDCPLPWQKLGLQETASGYGRKLTSTRKAKYNNRFYRVYHICYSNASTAYILSKGKMLIVNDCTV